MINKKCINIFQKRPLWLYGVAYFLFALLLGYHGFSIGYWQDLVGSKPQLTLIGESKGVRSDDFMVGLPLAFAQIESGFETVNPLIGFGQNNLVTSYQIPVKHWTGFFKPLTWGYFVGANFGMSWHWNLNVVLLFFAIFLFFKKFSSFDQKIIFWLSTATFFSTFFQYWSYIGAPYFYWSLFMVLLLKQFSESPGIKIKVALGFLFTWSLGCFTFTIYPPFQIFGVYFVAIFALLFLIQSRHKRSLVLLYFAAVSVILLLIYRWSREAADVIHAVSSTAYPGRRFTLGGAGQWIHLLQNNLFLKDAFNLDANLGGNTSEGSGFWSLFIPLLLILSISWSNVKNQKKLLSFLTLIFLVLFTIWYFWGLPHFLAQVTGIALSIERRSVIFTAFLNVIFLVLYSTNKIPENKKHSTRLKWGFLFWTALQLYFLIGHCPSNQGAIAGAIAMTAFHLASVWYLFKGHTLRFAQIWAAAMLLSTFTFNPIVFRGYDTLFVNSELAKALLSADSEKKQIWLVDNDVVRPALPRILGLKSFGGPTFYPQREFWKIVDEKNEFEQIWNRYSAIDTKLVDSEKATVRLVYNDRVEIELPHKGEILRKLGITRILQIKANPSNVVPADFERLSETDCCLIWGRN